MKTFLEKLLSATIALIAAFLPTFSWVAGETLRPATAKECLALVPDKAFRSREGLLQLFHAGFRSGALRGVALEGAEIKELRKGVQTLFPLDACRRIEVGDSKLTLFFEKAVREVIPGTFRQGSLELSPRVEFDLAWDPKDASTLVFRIRSGEVNLRLSALARLGGLRELLGSELRYRLDEARRQSILSLYQRRLIPRSRIQVEREGARVTAVIDDRELGTNNRFVFSPGEMNFLGMRFELLASNTVRIANAQVLRDPATWAQLDGFLREALGARDNSEVLAGGLESVSGASYELEARRISLSRGYERPSKE